MQDPSNKGVYHMQPSPIYKNKTSVLSYFDSLKMQCMNIFT